jgi:amino acid transporter
MSTSPTPTPHSTYAAQPVASPPAMPTNTYPAASAIPVPVEVVTSDGRTAPASEPRHKEELEEVRIYSHSTFFYWRPVWLTGYIMAIVTRLDGQLVQLGNSQVWMHESKNLGVLFTLIFFLVILITNVTLRGLASVVAILAAAFGALLLAYYGWWEEVLNWMGRVSIFMNMGFYVLFSTLVFIVWAFSVFVYDRLSYWRVTPGQLTCDAVVGGAQKSYDARGMVFEKHRQDLFRHWIIGFGSGDIEISTTGARRETFNIPNVLFVDSKVGEIQHMIAMQPDQFQPPAV